MKNDSPTGSSIWRRYFLDRNAPSLILLIALIMGLLIWAADAALDYFVFYEGGFLELLLLNPPQHEIYIRFLILLCFLGFGGVVANVVLNLQNTRSELQNKETNLKTTLHSIGDAVIATDARGRIQRMNEQSESLTGWGLDEVQGLPLENIFRIVNAVSREPVANPVQKVLEEGTIQGLANHTVLIAKDGTEYQIADSASPIRSEEGSITGVVLVFRDVTEQYHQEELLRKQRLRLAHVVEGTDAGIWERNIQTLEFFFDVTWLQHLGYDPEKFSEMDLYTWRELLHPEDLEKSDRLIAEHLSGHLEAYECEIRVRRRDGSWAWVLDRGKVTERTTDGEPLLFSGTVQDITERKQSEEALQESQRQLATLMGNLPGMAYRCLNDPYWTMLFVSEGCLELTGFSPQDLIENRRVSYAELTRPEDEDRVWKEVQQGLEQSGHFEVEYRILTAEGEEKYVWEQGTGVYQEGRLVFLEGFITDITGRKQAEQAIENERAYLSAVIDNIEEAIVICDAEGRIARFNEAARRLHGLPEQPIPSEKWAEHYDLYQEDGVTPLSMEDIPLFRALQGERVLNAEIVVAPKHNRPYDLICSGQALTDETGKMTGAVVAMHDISERKRMEQSLRRERDLSQRYLDTTQTTMVALNVEGRITMINRSGRELLGYTEEEILGCNWFETCLPHTEGMDSVYPVFRSIMAGDLPSVEYFENNILCRDGTQRLMGWHNAFLEDDEGRVVGTLSSGEDITARKQAEKRLQSAHDKLDTLVQLNADGLMVLNQEGRILFLNPAAAEMMGRDQDELWGEQFGHPLIPGSNTEIELLSTAGEVRVAELRARETEWSEQTALLVSFRDITERKRAEERIYYLAYYDELTGLPNRRLFQDRLRQVAPHSEYIGVGGAVFLMDITRLREVNDTLGQQAGDELIREVARRIGDTVGEKDTVARVSGGEFMVLSEGRSTDERARNLGLCILEGIGRELELSGRLVYPEVNMGFTLFPDRGTDPDTLIKQADLALSEAKKSAHSIQDFAGQEDWISRLFHLEHDLKQALVNGEFFLCYQSQIDLRTGRIMGLEALLRWKHPQRGVISPSEFIPVLEKTGMIASADAWVIHRVCKQLGSWQERGILIKTSINLSAQELSNDATIEVFRAALEENGAHPENLEVEITETALMENVDRASRILQTLSSWGARVALDDFGKGYSSLSYLQKLAINTIKIDKQFVDGLPKNQDSVTLVQTIISMAHNLGKKVLAEGVEYEEQRQKLCELGCDYGQGFLWSRPQPVENLPLTKT